ncbi:PTD012 family protein [Escherichia coli]|nr:PTD012 family protein [Escherichia coli]
MNPVKQHPMPEFMPTPLARFLKSRPEVMQWIAIYFRSHACFSHLTLLQHRP